jgi:cytidylate kinase
LLQRIGDDLGVRGNFLESMDERHVNWLSECLEGFSWAPAVSQLAYVRRLVETMLSLAARGECVIVGRGATKVLPLATTVRVRIVAPLKYRIEAVQREHGISSQEAARRVEEVDRERDRFVTEHFLSDPTDPANYDLVLNVARFQAGECADIIIAALQTLRGRRSPDAAKHAVAALGSTSN